MLILEGQVLGVIKSERVGLDGVIDSRAQVEILHRVRGKSRVDTVRIDVSVVPAWEKVAGKDVRVDVDFYAMPVAEGQIVSGFMMADKKALPVIVSASNLKAA